MARGDPRPIGFLTAAERERLSRFPEHIPEDDLSVFFLLPEAAHQAVNRQYDDHTRLGFALPLCTLRYLGFVPHDLGTAPSLAVGYVAEQLHGLPEVIAAYGSRIATRTTHLQQVQRHLGFRRATPLDVYALQTWLLERALEHAKPTLLLQLACDKLRREHIVRPGITRLERFVATARQQAHDETWRRLEPLLSTERQAFLDGLLTPEPTTGRTSHSGLRQEAVSPAAAQIIATLQKIGFLQDAGVDQWDLASLNPNRAKWLAQIGWKSTNQYLQRMAPERRYPVLVAFLQQALLHHTDVAVELFDQCVWGCHSEAKQELEEFRKAVAHSTNEKLKLFRELGHVLLDDEIEDPDGRAVSFEVTFFVGHRDHLPVAVSRRNLGDEDRGGLLSRGMARRARQEGHNAHECRNGNQQGSDAFHDTSSFQNAIELMASIFGLTLRFTCRRKPERGTSGRWRQSGAVLCSALDC